MENLASTGDLTACFRLMQKTIIEHKFLRSGAGLLGQLALHCEPFLRKTAKEMVAYKADPDADAATTAAELADAAADAAAVKAAELANAKDTGPKKVLRKTAREIVAYKADFDVGAATPATELAAAAAAAAAATAAELADIKDALPKKGKARGIKRHSKAVAVPHIKRSRERFSAAVFLHTHFANITADDDDLRSFPLYLYIPSAKPDKIRLAINSEGTAWQPYALFRECKCESLLYLSLAFPWPIAAESGGVPSAAESTGKKRSIIFFDGDNHCNGLSSASAVNHTSLSTIRQLKGLHPGNSLAQTNDGAGLELLASIVMTCASACEGVGGCSITALLQALASELSPDRGTFSLLVAPALQGLFETVSNRGRVPVLSTANNPWPDSVRALRGMSLENWWRPPNKVRVDILSGPSPVPVSEPLPPDVTAASLAKDVKQASAAESAARAQPRAIRLRVEAKQRENLGKAVLEDILKRVPKDTDIQFVFCLHVNTNTYGTSKVASAPVLDAPKASTSAGRRAPSVAAVQQQRVDYESSLVALYPSFALCRLFVDLENHTVRLGPLLEHGIAKECNMFVVLVCTDDFGAKVPA
jgi:hypothetical protein